MDHSLVAEVEGLNARLLQTKEKIINSWKSQYDVLQAENEKEYHLSLAKLQDELQSHKENIEKIQQQVICDGKELESRAKALQELKQALQIVMCNTDSSLQTQEALTNQRENKMHDLEKKKDLLVHQSKATEKQLREIEMYSKFYSERLALNIIKCSGGRLQFVFTSINPNDPEAVCYFFMKIEGENRKYNVVDCEPAVPDLEELVEKLNRTNNLKSFVVAVRKRFKDIECKKS
ncbi:hypothetical protein FSP39_004318 [Pinctada imbricata]|uniref:Kinetochore protein SPC25 n=1 Tax=Pinctada imbricata TaxID=66713 RepID=A0AA88YN06_PINIB|nr:hypothetical protein FSP39_004318 [Pinctada imbricata]